MSEQSKTKKNPSRETCESVIRRILTAEAAQKGRNTHFCHAADFMSYFESLYPASDSLTKQVQRAVRAMNMPKDEHGCFIIDKTEEQLTLEDQLKRLLKSDSPLVPMECSEPLFLPAAQGTSDYVIHLLQSWEPLQGKYITMQSTFNGILIYTIDKAALLPLLKELFDCQADFPD